ncbi:MAG: hypothetical protein RLZZ361_1363 [Cyanobacteriota bacterium]|jgi:DNA-binding transcriptional LysR family regulator
MKIGIEELEALITIMQCGSFRAAAEKLHKSQSSISYAIKNIEDDLGVEIFDRSTYTPKLSSAGELIYNKAKNILGLHGELMDIASYIQAGIEPKINVVFSVVFPTKLLRNILQKFTCKFPQTQLGISFASFDSTVNSLLEQKADLVVSSDYSKSDILEKEFFSKIEFVPVADPQHPAAQPGFDKRRLTSMIEVVVGERALTAEITPSGQIEHPNTWHVMDFELKKQFLLAGLGWGFMPRDLISKELSTNELTELPCVRSKHINLYLMRHKSSCHGPALNYLWDLLITLKEPNPIF